MTIGEFRAFVSGMALSIKDAPDAFQWAAIQAALATVTDYPALPSPAPATAPIWPHFYSPITSSGVPPFGPTYHTT